MQQVKTNRLSSFFRSFLTTLRGRFLLGFIALGIAMALIFFFYFRTFASNQIIQQTSENQSIRIENAIRMSDRELSEFNEFIYWIISNNDLEQFLLSDDPSAMEAVRSRRTFYNTLSNLNLYSTVKQRINLLCITGKNGSLIRFGKNAYNMDISRLAEYGWYADAHQTNGSIVFYPAMKNFNMIPLVSTYQPDEYVTPVFKYLKYGMSSEIVGEVIILIDSNMLLNREIELSSKMVDLYVDSSGCILASSDVALVGTSLSDEPYYCKALKNENGTFTSEISGVRHLITSFKSQSTGGMMLSIVPIHHVTNSMSSIFNSCILMLGVLLLFVFLISLYLSSNFTKPVNAVVHRINEISNGIFHTEKLELHRWNVREMEFLSERLTIMEANLQRLLESEINREKERRMLEIQILQAQISPHFLNNTLSTIRMMATIQGSQGIAAMLQNLSTIIAATLQNSSEKITLRQELSIVSAYSSIQRIRYHGRIEFAQYITDKSLLDTMILKFTLQPIIENAIFHGIVPKNQLGHIFLKVERLNDNIQISISDDGVGFSKEKKDCILTPPSIGADGALHGVGLYNIDRRLKLVYGEKYGISLPSDNAVTTVAVLLPIEFPADKEANHESSNG